ncbi:hypothetical protein DMH88_18555 [Escherichia coli]|nr:hypothetical protein [Escherichia coli]
MPSARLQQQFIRLWQCCEGKSQETTLNELAALLSCSRVVICAPCSTPCRIAAG